MKQTTIQTRRKKVRVPFFKRAASPAAAARPSRDVDALVRADDVHVLKGMLADEKKLKQLQDSEMNFAAIQNGDVDALMIAEQVFTLKDSGPAYRHVVEQMQEGSLTVTDGMIVSCNQYFAAMVSCELRQITGKRLLDLVAGDDRGKLAKLNKECLTKKSRARIHFLSRDEMIPAFVSAVRLAIKGPETFFYVITDLTLQSRHKKIQGRLKKKTSLLEEMSRLNEELNFSKKKQEKFSRELTVANRKLKKIDETKTMFMAMAAHDLKNPLHIVRGFADLLLATPNPNPEESQKYLRIITANVELMTRLINSLFDISKIDSGKISMNLSSKLDLNKILKSCIAARLSSAENKSTSMNTKLDNDLDGLYGDADRLYQVFDNLLSNALKYTPRGGKIDIETRNSNDRVEAIIRDNGIGMEELDLDKIFEPFQRLQAAGLEGEESTGLGLTLVRKIVEAHGGAVEVSSAVGKGSTFTVILPKRIQPINSIKEKDTPAIFM